MPEKEQKKEVKTGFTAIQMFANWLAESKGRNETFTVAKTHRAFVIRRIKDHKEL